MIGWILVALASYFFVALSDIFDKVVRDKFVRNSYTLIVLNGFLNLVIAILLIMTKPSSLEAFNKELMILSGITGIWASIPYFQALARNEASRIAPLFNFIPIFSLILSFIFLGESLTNIQLIAFVFIVAGGFLISMKSLKGIFRPYSGFWLMMLSCFLYAISFIIIKSSLQTSDFYTVQSFVAFGYFIGGMSVIPYSLISKKAKISEFHYKLPAIGLQSINQLVYLVGRLLLNIAFTLAPVALVVSLGGFIGFFVLIISVVLSLYFPKILKEEISKAILLTKTIALTLMFIGIWLLS